MDHKVRKALLLLGVAILNFANANDSSCYTPNKDVGECINLKKCASLLALLTSPNRQKSHDQYLKDSQCGYEGSTPKVCCPDGPFLSSTCGITEQSLLGSKIATPTEFPWSAILQYHISNGTIKGACGGVLINKRYVLTAAHCVKGIRLPETWKLESVRLGEYNTVTERDCIPDGPKYELCTDPPLTVRIEEQIVHEDYTPLSQDQRYDIALLRLAQDVPFTTYIKPICLPSSSNLKPELMIIGWGMNETHQANNVKRKGYLKLVDKRECSTIYQQLGVTLGEGQLCARESMGFESCSGDSGGALIQKVRDADDLIRWKVVGVASFGPSPCGTTDVPGVHTKVYDYRPWIESKLRP